MSYYYRLSIGSSAMTKVYVITLLFVLSNSLKAQGLTDKSADIVSDYIGYSRILVQNTVGFSAPISARAFAYTSIAAHEAAVDFVPEISSLSGKLTGYDRPASLIKPDDCALPVVLNHVYYGVMTYLFRGAPKYYLGELNAIYKKYDAIHRKSFSKRTNKNSIAYAEHLTAHLLEWSKLDSGDDAFLHNYSDTFKNQSCDSCWVQTTPGYLPALLPYWRHNTTLISGVKEAANNYTTMKYEEDSSSVLFNEALSVFINSQDENVEFKIIAEYWDDGTGVSGTPSGHLFSIAQQLASKYKLGLSDLLKLYSTLGIVMNDAVIACWELKYAHNFIRPITYIQRFIAPQFNTRIDTPSFPESPSGHSFHSGSAGVVFKLFFGNEVELIDNTNVNRQDINGTPRQFNTIDELVNEISISRFYGGIHFKKTLDESVLYGEKLGMFIIQKLED
jgi:hypothetical protein